MLKDGRVEAWIGMIPSFNCVNIPLRGEIEVHVNRPEHLRGGDLPPV